MTRTAGTPALDPVGLAELVSSALGQDAAFAERARPLLEQAIAEAALVYPGVGVPTETFAEYLVERLPRTGDPLAELAAACVRDLVLACGCRLGHGAALAAFDAVIFADVRGALATLAPSAAEHDEIHQLVRHRLFVAEPGQSPRIADYSGQGNLRAWVRVVVVRIALNLKRDRKGDSSPEEDALAELAVAGEDPALAAIKGQAREAFREAVRQALGELPARERTVLRQYFLDNLTIDQLGELYKVHRATAARWVIQARTAVRDDVKQRLMDQLALGDADAESMLRLVAGSLDFTVSGILRTG